MASNLPLENLHATDISPHSHVVQFYTLNSTLMNSLTSFVRSSLRAGDAVVVVATDAHRRDLQMRLKLARVNVRYVVDQGRLQLLDAQELLASIIRDGEVDWQEFQRAIGPVFAYARKVSRSRFRNCAAFGEMVALLAREKKFESALRLERCWNQFARTTRIVLHCGYPMQVFADPSNEESYLRICREHTNVLPA